MYRHAGNGNLPAEVATEDGITREPDRQIAARVMDPASGVSEQAGAPAP